jgi:hypothetical protein
MEEEDENDELFQKSLAILSLICTTFIYSILIWFAVCRADRLTKSDEERKLKAIKARKEKSKRKKISETILQFFSSNENQTDDELV